MWLWEQYVMIMIVSFHPETAPAAASTIYTLTAIIIMYIRK